MQLALKALGALRQRTSASRCTKFSVTCGRQARLHEVCGPEVGFGIPKRSGLATCTCGTRATGWRAAAGRRAQRSDRASRGAALEQSRGGGLTPAHRPPQASKRAQAGQSQQGPSDAERPVVIWPGRTPLKLAETDSKGLKELYVCRRAPQWEQAKAHHPQRVGPPACACDRLRYDRMQQSLTEERTYGNMGASL